MSLKYQLGVEDWVEGAADGQERLAETQLSHVISQTPKRLGLLRLQEVEVNLFVTSIVRISMGSRKDDFQIFCRKITEWLKQYERKMFCFSCY